MTVYDVMTVYICVSLSPMSSSTCELSWNPAHVYLSTNANEMKA